MENAAKALIMAGGILIGLIVFAMFVYEMTAFASHSRIYEERIAQQQTMEFNSQFEKYLNQDITAQDVVTIYNLTVQWNEGHPEDDVKISWGSSGLSDSAVENNETFLTDHVINKQDIFLCKINKYDKWGRVRELSISINNHP